MSKFVRVCVQRDDKICVLNHFEQYTFGDGTQDVVDGRISIRRRMWTFWVRLSSFYTAQDPPCSTSIYELSAWRGEVLHTWPLIGRPKTWKWSLNRRSCSSRWNSVGPLSIRSAAWHPVWERWSKVSSNTMKRYLVSPSLFPVLSTQCKHYQLNRNKIQRLYFIVLHILPTQVNF